MNFFEDQEKARSSTQKLIWLYTGAIILTALATGFGLLFVFWIMNQKNQVGSFGTYYDYYQQWVWIIAGITLVVILIVSFIKIITLGKGGEYVAQMSGAIPAKKSKDDFLLNRYINVVEEMSIASGTPLPKIYIMEDEPSINAFAAGYTIDDCVIAVTRGCLEKLDRDELQGVVAHEYSHIFNGDMKLNIKLIGYLSGLLFLKNIGHAILRGNRRSYRSSRRGGGQAGLVGLVLLVVGAVGYFFGALIKSLISQQREYLADASAVQFTRNPSGISGALKKIMVLSSSQELYAAEASEISHLYFTEGLNSWFETHPPLPTRIRRIEPNFKLERFELTEKKDLLKELTVTQKEATVEKEKRQSPPLTMPEVMAISAAVKASEVQKAHDNIGVITDESLSKAQSVIQSIPDQIKDALYIKDDAKLITLTYFLHHDEKYWEEQLSLISKNELDLNRLMEIISWVAPLDKKLRLPIIELALGTLKSIERQEKVDFLKLVQTLIKSDKKITATEFTIYQILKGSMFPRETFFDRKITKTKSNQLKKPLIDMTKSIAQGGKLNFSISEINESLTTLRFAHPSFKQKIMDEIVRIICHDQEITYNEYEFAHLISLSLGIPLPL
jgi:Zn-dependent protease with chaperone function